MKNSTEFQKYILISPAQVILVFTILIPSIYIIWLSFNKSTYGAGMEFVGLGNYIAIFSDPVFWRSFINTFVVTNFIVWGEMVFGLCISLLLCGKLYFKKILFSIIVAPYAVTPVTAVVMWRYMVEPDVGFINYLCTSLGGGQLDWVTNPLYGLLVASLVSIYIHLPFTIIILYSALISIPNELIEAGRVDGANGWQVFWKISLPTIMPAVLVALMFRYIFAMRLFTEVWLLTGGGPARLSEVLAVYLFRAAFRYNEFGVSAATGLAMQVLSLMIAIFYLYKLYERMGRDV